MGRGVSVSPQPSHDHVLLIFRIRLSCHPAVDRRCIVTDGLYICIQVYMNSLVILSPDDLGACS